MYSKQVKRSLMQRVESDNIVLSITRVQQSSRGFHRVVYFDICMVYGARCIFRSLESNFDRVWHIYSTIKQSIV